MLDISFYTANDGTPCIIEVAKEFLVWLAESDFFKIGESKSFKLKIEGEEDLKLVVLAKETRNKLKTFLRDAIINESDLVINELGDSPSKQEVQAITYRLKKLLELLKCVENEKYQYLQRV